MSDLKALIARYAQAGQVAWIGMRSARGSAMHSVQDVTVSEDGLSGDHGRPGKRAVTLIQADHLVVIGAMLGRGPVAADIRRRNLIVSGINLSALKGCQVQVGTAVLSFDVICAPCSRMEAALLQGGIPQCAAMGDGVPAWSNRVSSAWETRFFRFLPRTQIRLNSAFHRQTR